MNDDFSRQLGDRLRIARLNRGLTLAQVEERSGGRWTSERLGHYECGRRPIKAETFLELAAFYRVRPKTLLPGAGLGLQY